MKINPYKKTEWIDEIIDTTYPENDPNRMIQKGTPFKARYANNIEDGIYNANGSIIFLYEEYDRMRADIDTIERAPINNGSFLDMLDGTAPRNLIPQNEKAVAQAALTAGATTINLDANPFVVGTFVTVYDDVNQEVVKVTAKNGTAITVSALTKTYKKGAYVARSNAIVVDRELTRGTWGTFTVTATEVV